MGKFEAYLLRYKDNTRFKGFGQKLLYIHNDNDYNPGLIPSCTDRLASLPTVKEYHPMLAHCGLFLIDNERVNQSLYQSEIT